MHKQSVGAVVVLAGLGSIACKRTPAPAGPAVAESSTPARAAAESVTVASASPSDDGTDAKTPTLSPDDASFVDKRKGWDWSDRCFGEIKQGKWGWARAACDRGLSLPEVDAKVRPLLLFNEGLIAKQAGDEATARSYFAQSLAGRSPTDPGRGEVEKNLVSVGGSVPDRAPAAPVQTFTGKALVEQMGFAHGQELYSDLNFATLYSADIDNDGRADFVLCERNSVGLHNDQILGVYRANPKTGAMTGQEIVLPQEGPFVEGNVFYFARPFLLVDPEGVTMNFVEGKKRARYLWTGGHVRLLDRT